MTVDQIVDVIFGNCKYIKCLYVYNKIDTVDIEDVYLYIHRFYSFRSIILRDCLTLQSVVSVWN